MNKPYLYFVNGVLQILKSVQDLKEQIHMYEDFTTSLGGYSILKNPKKLVKYLERFQNQINLTEDKVK